MIVNYRANVSVPRAPYHTKMNVPSRTLFIGNMSYEMSDQDLNDLFRDIENVVDVRVAIDRRTGTPKGFAHADFTDILSAERAFAILGRKRVYGRSLRVDYSSSGPTRTSGPRAGSATQEEEEETR